MRFAPGSYAVYALANFLFLAGQLIPALIVKAIFDRLTGHATAALGIPALIALFVAVESARFALSFAQVWGYVTFLLTTGALVRRNILAAILRRPGAVPLAVPPGAAVNRFRGDVDETADFPTSYPNVAAYLVGPAMAAAIMARIDLTITIFVVLPLLVAAPITWVAWNRIREYYKLEDYATDDATGFLAEGFDAVQALKLAGAAEGAMARFAALNRTRQTFAVRRRFTRQAADSITASAVSFGIGMVLLLAARDMAQHTFTVGDFALFVYFLQFNTEAATTVANFLGDYAAQSVCIARMEALVLPESPAVLVEYRPVEPTDRPSVNTPSGQVRASPAGGSARGKADGLPRTTGTRRTGQRRPFRDASGHVSGSSRQTGEPEGGERLETLQLRDLTYLYGGGGGIRGVDASIRRGTLTVVTGSVGSGKTTLLRTVLGLLPAEAGEVRWNDRAVANPAAFLQPPRAAYVPQVPKLFSQALIDNILLGRSASEAELIEVIRQAVLEADLDQLDDGLNTVVGPRGVRLSGGQVQRTAAARALVCKPQLLVVDDLSSSLDVETEKLLWDRLLAQTRMTVLAVSHRRATLARADRVIVMREGEVAAQGSPTELLAASDEMRRLWIAGTKP
jgi:ATP-binding cassette subfamily B protein